MSKIYQLWRSLAIAASIFFAAGLTVNAADTYPKREIRSVWMSTAWAIDWPSVRDTKATTITKQKNEVIAILDRLKAAGYNAVNFQVRPFADRFYSKNSWTDPKTGTTYTVAEPWSAYISGTRGTSVNWDPLQFWIDEAHKRGMELHAWVNPYRMLGSFSLSDDKAVQSWTITYTNSSGSTKTIFNPALPQTIARISNVCRVLAGNYDIDGIVFDDYFYPEEMCKDEKPTTPDYAQYKAYVDGGGTMKIPDWRRDNINKMVDEVNKVIKGIKPWVRFGISPAGVAGAGLKTSDGLPKVAEYCSKASDWQYASIGSDPIAWLRNQSIDYISPQIYWTTTHSTNPFGPLSEWWSVVAKKFGRHFYASHSVSFLAEPNDANGNPTYGNDKLVNWQDVGKQVMLNRQNTKDGNFGSVYYSNKNLTDGLMGHLTERYHQHKSLVPAMTWYDAPDQGTVENLKLANNTLSWTVKDGQRYIVYAVPKSTKRIAAKSDKGGLRSEFIVDVTYSPTMAIPSDRQSGYWYGVSVLDRYGNEWALATLDEPSDEPPVLNVGVTSVNFGEVAIGKRVTKELTVTGQNLTDKISITVSGAGFSATPSSFTVDQAGGKVKITFVPTKEGEMNGTLTVSTPGATGLSITLSGTGYKSDVPVVEGEIESLTEVFNFSNGAGTADGTWVVFGQPHTRSIAFNGDDLYVLNTSQTTPEILVVDTKTGKDTGNRLSIKGISGGTYALSHIEMLGTSLYGSNFNTAGNTLKIYRWKDAAGDPEVVLSFTVPAGWTRLGETLSVWGDEENGKLMVYFVNNLVVFDVNDGVVDQTPTIIVPSASLAGYNSNTGVVYNGDDTYTIVPNTTPPTRIDAQGKVVEKLPTFGLKGYGTDAKAFDFGSKRYLATVGYKGTASNKGGVLNVVDITDGLATGQQKFLLPSITYGLGDITNGSVVTDVDVQFADDGRTVNIAVLVPAQGFAMYTYTAPAPDPGYQPAYDPTVYEEREFKDLNVKLALENNWVRHETANPLDLDIELHRDMVARYDAAADKDIVYVISRDKATADAKTALIRYDGETGEQLPTLELTYDAAWSPGYYPGNGIRLDDDNRLVTHTLSLANNNIGIAVVDPETGNCTTMLVDKTEKRIDHLDVAGSVADDSEWYAIAGSPDAVTRWTMKGKTIVRKEVMNLPSTVGNASRVYAIDGNYFWLNGQSVHASLYEFGNTTPLATLDGDVSAEEVQASVVHPFTFNGKSYLLFQNNYPQATAPIQWKLAIGNNFTRTVDNARHIWTFPDGGLGTARMTSGDFGAPVSVVTDVKPEARQTPVARLYAYSYGNGMASYTLRPLVTDGVENIAVDADTAPEWYDIHGIRISKPTIPGIYIKVIGKKTEKVIVK